MSVGVGCHVPPTLTRMLILYFLSNFHLLFLRVIEEIIPINPFFFFHFAYVLRSLKNIHIVLSSLIPFCIFLSNNSVAHCKISLNTSFKNFTSSFFFFLQQPSRLCLLNFINFTTQSHLFDKRDPHTNSATHKLQYFNERNKLVNFSADDSGKKLFCQVPFSVLFLFFDRKVQNQS